VRPQFVLPFDRRLAVGAMLAGVTWSMLAIDSIARPEPEPARGQLVLLPFVLTLVGVVGLHARQRDRSGPLGRFGFAVVVGAMVAVVVGQIGMVVDVDGVRWLGFPGGVLVWTVGMAIFGVSTARAGVLPVWCGAALALAEPLTIAAAVALSPIAPRQPSGSYSGAIAHGLIWLAIALLLWTRAAGGGAAGVVRVADLGRRRRDHGEAQLR
jgi:hypothetical protein